jgi:hypothetical protein
MDAVMLVEVFDVHGQVRFQHRRSGADQTLRIGRGLHCDIVLDDPYVAADHTLLRLLPDGRVHVQDLGSINSTRVNSARIVSEAGTNVTDGELIIGRTRLRVRGSAGVLQPERRFRRDPLRRHRTLLALGGLSLCVLFAIFTQWREAPERLAPRVLVAVLLTLGGVALWSFVWSLVSRLSNGEWRIRVHLAIASLGLAIGAWGYWLAGVIAFALQWRWLDLPLGLIGAALALAMAWLHLRFATRFRRRAALALALLAPPVLVGVWWLVDLQRNPLTVNRIDLGPEVLPPALRLAPSMDLDDYLSDVAALKREARDNRQRSLLEAPLADE